MPNHIKNVLKIKSLSQNEIEDVLNKYTEQLDEGFFPLNCFIDFNKIIPEPKTKEECPEECLVTKDSCISIREDKAWFDWYTWHTKYWGTKWGAYDAYIKIGRTYITFVFNTAWSAPIPVIDKLVRTINHDVSYRYADEDYGSNCDCLNYHADTGKWESIYLKDETQFAMRLWDKW